MQLDDSELVNNADLEFELKQSVQSQQSDLRGTHGRSIKTIPEKVFLIDDAEDDLDTAVVTQQNPRLSQSQRNHQQPLLDDSINNIEFNPNEGKANQEQALLADNRDTLPVPEQTHRQSVVRMNALHMLNMEKEVSVRELVARMLGLLCGVFLFCANLLLFVAAQIAVKYD